jgi:hypothetical protein
MLLKQTLRSPFNAVESRLELTLLSPFDSVESRRFTVKKPSLEGSKKCNTLAWDG